MVTSQPPVVAGLDGIQERMAAVDSETTVVLEKARLGGHFTMPPDASGIVVFAHGSGSSRHSPGTRYVAGLLHEAALGTLLFDLLMPKEEIDRSNVFNIDLLASRLLAVIGWLRQQPAAADLPVGLYGVCTGGAAALSAATDPAADVAAVVCRCGRPDLAGPRLDQVTAPTLFVVGGLDDAVLTLTRTAQAGMRCPNDLAVVPGATHRFEEPGTLRAAAERTADWFNDNLLAHQHTPGR
ncbi:MAG TPA: dienelactone hydrolase family protein [Planosporangium sp.]|jgi:putative phosphoribosyl transferase|nr:dienelactone hydrolase family protein [Planosporangium sp.]